MPSLCRNFQITKMIIQCILLNFPSSQFTLCVPKLLTCVQLAFMYCNIMEGVLELFLIPCLPLEQEERILCTQLPFIPGPSYLAGINSF